MMDHIAVLVWIPLPESREDMDVYQVCHLRRLLYLAKILTCFIRLLRVFHIMIVLVGMVTDVSDRRAMSGLMVVGYTVPRSSIGIRLGTWSSLAIIRCINA